MFEGQAAAPEAANTGVTETTDAPTSEEAAPASDAQPQGRASGDTGVDEALSPANIRIQKLANENRQYRERLKRFEQDNQSLSGARTLHELLSKNPQHIKTVMDLLNDRAGPAVNQSDPFEGYEPHVAEALRASMELKQWREKQEEQQQQHYQNSVKENEAALEDAFEQRLLKDGFMEKDGSYDDAMVRVLSGAVLTEALRIARNPEMISQKELNAAYDNVLKGTKSLEKRALKNTVSISPPPSGSQRGTIPVGRTKETEDQRIARMAKEYSNFKG